MVVYDISDSESFKSVENWMHEIDKWASPNVNKILIGNKSDKENERQISFDEGLNLAKHYGIPFMEVSAKNGNNIIKSFKLTTTEIQKRITKTNGSLRKEAKTLDDGKTYKPLEDKKSRCC